MSVIKIAMVLVVTLCCQACTAVKAWERGTLARPEMAFSSDPLEKAIQSHVYHSKEASQSVSSGAGGGCGCN